MRNVRTNGSDLRLSFRSGSPKQLGIGDFIIIARGRRYFSNDALISTLRDHSTPIAEFNLGLVPSAKIYELSQLKSLTILNSSRMLVSVA